ncbi:pentapeptide repeat-containing protein [Vogesella indigofera]|uniref:pentapeptide repeat-containing protein n=1 Tax=Vogesella indigofera TaxID=45465 RepID=UPI00234DEEDD|nr:pentapeptide repeat-containing protein [Vogesella indigofera]MDC7703832.1 hypothetical protein [Vogesella indigofera]
MNDTVKPELLSLPERLAALPPEVQALFTIPENGKPDNISKDGCLELARLGKDAWNAWRTAFPVGGEQPLHRNCADFSGVDFRKVPINFSGFIFGDWANFSTAQWGDWADFSGARWGSNADFIGTQWGDCADFRGAKWGSDVDFRGAQWGDRACFSGADWYGVAKFQGAMWGAWTDFSKTHWRGWVSFSGESWEKNRQLYLDEGHFEKAREWAAKRGLAPDSFQEIRFDEACFANGVNFSNRKFFKKARFMNSNFDFEKKEIQR